MRILARSSALIVLAATLAVATPAAALGCEDFNPEYPTYEACKAVVEDNWEPLHQWVQALLDEGYALATYVVDLAFWQIGVLTGVADELIVCLTGGPCPE